MEQAAISINFSNNNFVKTILRLIKQNCPEVETITFANNGIKSLYPFSEILNILPGVKNLSFENNLIRNFSELDHLSKIALREIVLKENPIANDVSYQGEVTRRFPQLAFLDSQPPKPVIQFSIPSYSKSNSELPIKGSFFDSTERRDITLEFLKKFISLYDTNRDALLDVYTENSIFSACCHFSSIKKEPNTRNSLTGYMPYSRNLVHVTAPDKRLSLANVGHINIIHTLKQLPQTKHSPDLVIDSFLLRVQGRETLLVSFHGSFWENPDGVNRSYDRIVTLAPAPPNSKARTAGWQVVIINDQLSVTTYSGNLPKPSETTKTEPIITMGEMLNLHITSPDKPLIHTSITETDPRVEAVKKLCFTTGLSNYFATKCLEENGWDYNAALQSFYIAQSKNRITKEMLIT